MVFRNAESTFGFTRKEIIMVSDNVDTTNRASTTTKSGLPGMRGIEHIGITVPNLQEAIDFFVNVLGCEEVYSMGTFKDSQGTWMSDNLDIHPRAEIPEFRIVSCGNGAHLEIFEFTASDQNTQMPKASDYGSTHFAFYVDDMDAAIAYLKSKDVRVLGGKKDGIGPEAGEDSSFAHFKTPWGHLVELVSFPKGRVYEKEKPSMWMPAK